MAVCGLCGRELAERAVFGGVEPPSARAFDDDPLYRLGRAEERIRQAERVLGEALGLPPSRSDGLEWMLRAVSKELAYAHAEGLRGNGREESIRDLLAAGSRLRASCDVDGVAAAWCEAAERAEKLLERDDEQDAEDSDP